MPMNFCSSCGDKVVQRIPEGDNRERYICAACGQIHYQNPKIVTGCLPVWEGSVLLCRRAIEPRYGKWTLPAGFMENDETSQQGAARETWEEARANVRIESLYTTMNLPHIDQIYLMFLAVLEKPEFRPGPESLEVGLFTEQQIPWNELAFPVISETLRYFFEDRKRGDFPHRTTDLYWLDRRTGRYQVEIL